MAEVQELQRHIATKAALLTLFARANGLDTACREMERGSEFFNARNAINRLESSPWTWRELLPDNTFAAAWAAVLAFLRTNAGGRCPAEAQGAGGALRGGWGTHHSRRIPQT